MQMRRIQLSYTRTVYKGTDRARTRAGAAEPSPPFWLVRVMGGSSSQNPTGENSGEKAPLRAVGTFHQGPGIKHQTTRPSLSPSLQSLAIKKPKGTVVSIGQPSRTVSWVKGREWIKGVTWRTPAQHTHAQKSSMQCTQMLSYSLPSPWSGPGH